MNAGDLEFFQKVRSSSREFLHDPRDYSLAEVQDWFAALPSNKKYYIIEEEEQEHNGYHTFFFRIGYFRTEECRWQIEIGADIHPDYRGKGLAKQAYKEFIEFLKETKERFCLTLEVLGHNIPAFNLYKSLGFEQYSYTEVERNGRLYPSIHMSLEVREA